MNTSAFRDLVNGYRQSRIILTAFELDLFTVIGKQHLAINQIAVKAKIDERATEILLNALSALGLLKKKDNRFSNTDFSYRYLSKRSSDYMGGLMHSSNLWDNWSKLTKVTQYGHPVGGNSVKKRESGWLEPFIAAMHDRAKKDADQLVGNLNLSNVKTILDLGGGPGTYAMAMARTNNRIKAFVYDLPQVTKLTNNYIKAYGLEPQVGTIPGDFMADPIGAGYDLIFVSAIIHSYSYKDNAMLVKKCADALEAGGQLVIQDHIMDEDKTAPLAGALFAVNMLVNTTAGNTYSESEVRQWFKEAGLQYEKRINTNFQSTQLIGRKALA